MKWMLWLLVLAAAFAASPVLLAGAPPGEEAGEEGEEEEGPTASIHRDKDAVILRDGTRIDGTIVCAGQMGVVILTAEGEKTFLRAKVERIIKNADPSTPDRLPIEEVDGHKHLVDPFAVPKPAEEKMPDPPIVAKAAAQPAEPGEGADERPAAEPKPVAPKPKGPAKPVKPKAKATPAAPKPKPAPKAKQPKAKPAQPKAPVPPKGVQLQLPQDPQKIKDYIKELRKQGKLDDMLRDEKTRKAILDALRKQ